MKIRKNASFLEFRERGFKRSKRFVRYNLFSSMRRSKISIPFPY